YIDRVAEGAIAAAESPGITNFVLKSAYIFDGWERGWNLFPSFHCMNSVFVYLGMRKRPEIRKSTQITWLVIAILICASTVLTKQHYIIDVVGGVALPIICHVIVQKLDPGEKLVRSGRHL
ncbi:MAG: phosphatase PAP2 family protein, partial [Spirochaetales bacterium]|nr:phosphatase PAP2 family protein [Spirochaetales bacterium]